LPLILLFVPSTGAKDTPGDGDDGEGSENVF